MDVLGISMGFLRDMGFLRISMGFRGFPRISMDFPRNSMDFLRMSMGFLWIQLVFLVLRGSNPVLWIQWGFLGFLRIA